MRICNNCNKEYEHFGQKIKLCRECRRAYDREYYKNHLSSPERKRRKYYLSRVRILGIYENLKNYCKDKPCEICGEDDYVVLEFDHIDPTTKVSSISNMIRDGLSWEAIKEELLKCRVLCCNCHRRHTAEQFGWYILKDTGT